METNIGIRPISKLEIHQGLNENVFWSIYKEGESAYYIYTKDVWPIFVRNRIPIVGMTPSGIESLMTRECLNSGAMKVRAIFLQPRSRETFQKRLAERFSINTNPLHAQRLKELSVEDLAAEEAERAVRFPRSRPSARLGARPERSERSEGSRRVSSSIFPVKINASDGDSKAVDEVLDPFLREAETHVQKPQDR